LAADFRVCIADLSSLLSTLILTRRIDSYPSLFVSADPIFLLMGALESRFYGNGKANEE
jgi:hypothetical protein